MDELNMSGEVDGRLYTASWKDGRITVYNHGEAGSRDYSSMTIPGSAEDFLRLSPDAPAEWFCILAAIVRGREPEFKRFEDRSGVTTEVAQ